MSKSPKKSGKQGSAREKDGTQIAFFTEPHPGRRRAGPPDDDDAKWTNVERESKRKQRRKTSEGTSN